MRVSDSTKRYVLKKVRKAGKEGGTERAKKDAGTRPALEARAHKAEENRRVTTPSFAHPPRFTAAVVRPEACTLQDTSRNNARITISLPLFSSARRGAYRNCRAGATRESSSWPSKRASVAEKTTRRVGFSSLARNGEETASRRSNNCLPAHRMMVRRRLSI